MVEKLATKYNLESIVGASFTLQYGFRFKYCASDVVYAMLALLESSVNFLLHANYFMTLALLFLILQTKERHPQHCFLDALDCLSRTKKQVLENGIDRAKLMLSNIYKTAQSILQMKQVTSTGPLLYVTIPEGTLDSRLFAHPHPLMMLAQFTLRAYVDASRNRRAPTWALVASAVFDPEDGTCLVVGVPPICEDPPKSLFGEAFKSVAEKTNCHREADYFDTSSQ